MTRFRPCIDLHKGEVKQIVGGTLTAAEADLKTNFVSTQTASYYASVYRDSDLFGAHVIMLGPGNDEAALQALSSWPNRLQIGGGITNNNARQWIECGAEKVIITSFLFPNRAFSLERLQSVLSVLGNDKSKLVIDLSCRRQGEKWFVAMDRWQTITEMEITRESIVLLEPYCSEFLIHAADNEGLQKGIDVELVSRLSEWCTIPVTYAGGAKTVEDLDLVKARSSGKVDLTIGSALDIFGGTGAKFEDCVAWNREQATS